MSAQMSNQTPEKGAWSALKEMPSNVWSSIFRNPLPSTDLERASTSFTNFFLHIHPVKVHKNTLRPIYTLGLGLISLFLFLILVVTGVLVHAGEGDWVAGHTIRRSHPDGGVEDLAI